jgi:glycosyltransferase involved in cell wall biosynthesis
MIFLINSLRGNGAEKVMSLLAQEIKSDTEKEIWLLERKIDIEYPKDIKVTFLIPRCLEKIKILGIFVAALILMLKLKGRRKVVNSFLFRASLVNILAKLLGSKHITIVHEHSVPSSLINGNRVLKFIYKLLYSKANRIVAVSQGVAHDINEITKNKIANNIYVIPNPCDIEKISTLCNEKIEEIQEIKKPYIVAVGRLERVKRFDKLIEAFERINCKGYLYILGEGSQKEDLEEIIKKKGLNDRVSIIPWTKNPYPIIKNANALVVTSKYESFSMVILEALACGTRVISIDCPYGPREILENGRYGVLIEDGKWDILIQNMRDALEAKNVAGDVDLLVARAKQYDKGNIINKYYELFSSLKYY